MIYVIGLTERWDTCKNLTGLERRSINDVCGGKGSSVLPTMTCFVYVCGLHTTDYVGKV